MMKKLAIVSFLAGAALALPALAAPSGSLERDFINPPDSTKPRCYWYWMDGHYTKEGITRDLEAMKRVGIGEAYIGLISGQCDIPAGPVQVLSEPFWDIMGHTIREGGRLGVDIGVFNSPGWSQSGGPWMKPEQSMRYLATYETPVHGPQTFKAKLAGPNGFFQNVAVMAFPKPMNDSDTVAQHAPKITASPASADAAKLFDGDYSTACVVEKGNVVVELNEAFTARSVTIRPSETLNLECKLEVSDDGQNYRTIRTFEVDRHNAAINVGPVPMAPITVAIPATKGRFFRFQFPSKCHLSEITLSAAPRLESYAEKQLMKVFQDPQPPFDFYSWKTQAEPEDASLNIAPDKVFDITKNLAPDGTLTWTVPTGDWIILRTVALPTGSKNAPAPPEATGLEADKMSRAALKSHFNAYVGELIRRIPAKDRKAWKHVVADSYETGPENWTDDLFTDFKARYGYDPKPYLPVLTGRLVRSADASERFLWDYRRLIADRVSKDYVGGLHDLCEKNGLRMWLENYGHWGFPGEFLQYGGACHEISGEFWATGSLGSVELRDAASAAHTYGMPQVFAEAFTGGPLFTSHPYTLKPRQDWSYCEGINQYTLHLYIQQPDENKPGISAPFGTEFNRHNTWFENSKSWIEHQRRSTVMLQHGKYVADVAYFIGEDAPKMTGQQKPELPVGYSFDYINADVIKTRLQVKDGYYVLPDGMRYRILVLPGGSMRPELAEKIKNLVADGGAILGEPPVQSPSLKDYPKCDLKVASIAQELWGTDKSKAKEVRTYGKGRVFRGFELTEALNQLATPPDLNGIDPGKILFIHRSSPEADIYFVCNQAGVATDILPTFRVKDRLPELWHPESGRIEYPAIYDNVEDGLKMPLHLDPVGSVFVVFRKEQKSDPYVKLLKDGKVIYDATASTTNKMASQIINGGTFSISLWVKPGEATPLPSEANTGVVGMAEHRNEIIFPQHGNTFGPGEANSGVGLSVGTNGVVVYEHGDRYFVPVLVHPVSLTNWTYLTVVYTENQPTLFINSNSVHTGLKSTRTAHPSDAISAQPGFIGLCGPIHRIGKAWNSSNIVSAMKATASEATDANATIIQAFRRGHRTDVVTSEVGDYTLVKRNGQQINFTVSDPPTALNMKDWTLEFPTNSGITMPVTNSALGAWHTQTNPLIKYFSGTATYKTQFDIATDWSTNQYRLLLDLGEVHDMAEVILNGKSLGTLWKPPFRIALNGVVKRGNNQLEIRVINVWHNRLVGQLKEPDAFKQPGVFQPVVLGAMGCGPNDALFPAGLIGPVSLRPIPHWSYIKD